MQGLEYDFVREAQVREEEESTAEEVFRRRREKRSRVLHFDERKSCDAEELVLSRMKRVTMIVGRKNSIVRTERDVYEKRTLALLRALSAGGRRYLFLLLRRRFRYCRR